MCETESMKSGKKTTVLFTDVVMPVLDHWRRRGLSLQEIVNAGAMAFHMGTPGEREKAREWAYLSVDQAPGIAPVEAIKSRMIDTLMAPPEAAEALRRAITVEIARDPRLSDAQRQDLILILYRLPGATPTPAEAAVDIVAAADSESQSHAEEPPKTRRRRA